MSAARRYAYFGPAGTFTEDALLRHLESTRATVDGEPRDYETVSLAIEAVRGGDADAAMVPFENSVEGSVAVTLDELAVGDPLVIVGEVVLPVSFGLLVRPGTTLADIKTAGGHPHAQNQYRKWFDTNLAHATWHPTASNSQAALDVKDGRFDAAFANPRAAAIYGLELLVDGIHDTEGAETRFVLVSRPGATPPPTGADKTSLVLFMGEDHPGALLEILTEQLAVRGVNLTRIESRPTGGGLGSYCFTIDAEGHLDDARVGEAMVGLHRVCKDVRFLGSYPRADRREPLLRPGVTDGEFAEAQAWLAAIRDTER